MRLVGNTCDIALGPWKDDGDNDDMMMTKAMTSAPPVLETERQVGMYV